MNFRICTICFGLFFASIFLPISTSAQLNKVFDKLSTATGGSSNPSQVEMAYFWKSPRRNWPYGKIAIWDPVPYFKKFLGLRTHRKSKLLTVDRPRSTAHLIELQTLFCLVTFTKAWKSNRVAKNKKVRQILDFFVLYVMGILRNQ